MSSEIPTFGNIRFSGTLRPSQSAATSIILPQLERGEKRLHIVAPPGSGKTILGLYVWADLLRKILFERGCLKKWSSRRMRNLSTLIKKEDSLTYWPPLGTCLSREKVEVAFGPDRRRQGYDLGQTPKSKEISRYQSFWWHKICAYYAFNLRSLLFGIPQKLKSNEQYEKNNSLGDGDSNVF